jgi:hypothetical protein
VPADRKFEELLNGLNEQVHKPPWTLAMVSTPPRLPPVALSVLLLDPPEPQALTSSADATTTVTPSALALFFEVPLNMRVFAFRSVAEC